ncbi:MAG: hypothetical protein KC713_04620 [Candidatus Omnitrophica bacterium]|nr:hypothetical protein [Candidatus Omnitrophota bacterium]
MNSFFVKFLIVFLVVILGYYAYTLQGRFYAKTATEHEKTAKLILEEVQLRPSIISVRLTKSPRQELYTYKRPVANDRSPLNPENNMIQKPTLKDARESIPSDENPSTENISKKIYLSPGRDFYEARIFQGEKQIATQVIKNNAITRQNGDIPDGKLEFINTHDQTYGHEHYKNGMIDGIAVAYFESGRLKKEEEFREGRLLKVKEFYPTGELRFICDYRNAREWGDNPEVGEGKVYHKNGKIKYEWNITTQLFKGYKKSYNRFGQLTSETYYDNQGNIVEQN